MSENEQRESLNPDIQEGDQDVVDLLRGDSALLDAAKKGNLSRIQKLLRVILNFDFNIQSDAVETTLVSAISPPLTLLFMFVQFLLMADRPGNENWSNFIMENKERFPEVFAELYEEIAGDE